MIKTLNDLSKRTTSNTSKDFISKHDMFLLIQTYIISISIIVSKVINAVFMLFKLFLSKIVNLINRFKFDLFLSSEQRIKYNECVFSTHGKYVSFCWRNYWMELLRQVTLVLKTLLLTHSLLWFNPKFW